MLREDIINIYIELIKKFISGQIDKNSVIDELIKRINCEEIYNTDDLIISDCYFALKHLNEEGSETSLSELQYFLDCFEGRKVYDLNEKNELIKY